MHKYLCLFISCVSCIPYQRELDDVFDLTVIHVNGIHAHFEEVSVNTTRCRPEFNGDCYGGVARVAAMRNSIMNQDPEAMFLNAGDFYQGKVRNVKTDPLSILLMCFTNKGTVWYTEFGYEPMIEFGNLLNYTAMGLGNHDFDDSIAGIKPFAERTTFDLLASNIQNNLNDASFQEGVHYNKSSVKIVKGVKVGIIGYITRSTDYNFPNGSLTFLDEIEAIQEEAK